MERIYKAHIDIEKVDGLPALAIGSAPCVYEEVNKAMEHHPDATIFCANKAVKVYQPDHICSFHYYEIKEFAEMAREEWGDIEFTTHGASVFERHKTIEDYPEVDIWWLTARQSAAVSGWFTARVAAAMGYNVIMCGSPMTGGDGYFPGDTVPTTLENPRFGHYPEGHGTLRQAQNAVRLSTEIERAGIVSMSGFTKDILGGPSWL